MLKKVSQGDVNISSEGVQECADVTIKTVNSIIERVGFIQFK